MKTVTVTQAKPQLGKLVEEVYSGAPIVLVHGHKLVKMERYEILDPDYDSPELAAMLLDAVRGPHAPYSHKEMRAVADRAIRESRRRVVFQREVKQLKIKAGLQINATAKTRNTVRRLTWPAISISPRTGTSRRCWASAESDRGHTRIGNPQRQSRLPHRGLSRSLAA